MNLNRRLGVGALVCGLAAPLAGSPYRSMRGAADVHGLAQVIMQGGDHVSALTLAGWIRARKPGLRVIDVRTPEEFAQWAIPTSENIQLDELLRTRFAPDEVVVLYSEGGAHAGQAWTLLRAIGVDNAWFIAGGLADWHEEVHTPVLPHNATPAEVRAFEETAALSRYFGGAPSVGERKSAAPKARRRGC